MDNTVTVLSMNVDMDNTVTVLSMNVRGLFSSVK
jgi:hypothetical protein